MNILITAGETSEKIDEVRHLTNHATGSLGKQIAENLTSEEEVTLYYIYGPKAILPKGDNIHFYPIHSVKDLYQQMETLLTTISFDFVVHSMAVSDYELESTSNEQLLAQELAHVIQENSAQSEAELAQLIEKTLLHPMTASEPAQKKISSKNEKLILVMKKAPKVISKIKEWQPNVSLIGFKLLVDVTEEELTQVAQNSIRVNQADWILANDLQSIDGDKHTGLLISESGIKSRFETKPEIAKGLADLMLNK